MSRVGADVNAATYVAVRPGVAYDLTESPGPPGYRNTTIDCEIAGPRAAATTITLQPGDSGTCWFINNDNPPTLTLVKVVDDPEEIGTAVDTDWELTADGPVAITGAVREPAVTTAAVPVGTYDLTEDGPDGYDASDWVCTGGTSTTADSVTLALGDNATCTITNTPVQPRLTLVKVVDDPEEIGTAVDTDWELTADGPVAITGAVREPAVTTAAVPVGTYDLTEDGPDGYDASLWTCEDADDEPVTVTDGTVPVALGDNITCTITNTPVPPAWLVLKLSDPESGSTVEPGEEVTYGVFLLRGDGVDPRDVVVTDDLSQVLNNATLVDGPTTCGDAACTVQAGTASISGTTLTWTVPVLSQPFVYVEYTVRVNPDAYGVTLKNQVTSPGSTPCVPENSEDVSTDRFASRALLTGPQAFSAAAVNAAVEDDDLCPTSTEHYTPAWTLEKTSDPDSGSEVDPGDRVTYTLTVANTTANAVVADAVVTDDLSDVLQYASLDSVPDGASLSGSTLTWTVPELQPGETAELSYTVTVDDDAYGVSFGNVATPGDGGECTTCTTDHSTPTEPGEPSTHLPDTGGTSLVPLGLGVGFLIAGLLVLNEARRRQYAKVRVRSPNR